MENALNAAALYNALGDLAGEGRSYWVAALSYFKLNKNDDVQPVVQRSLALCRQAGDLYGVGNALNVLTFVDADIAENMKRLEQGRRAFESAGYLERQIICTGNLANAYCFVGAAPAGSRLLQESIIISRRMGARLILAYNLSSLVEEEIYLDQVDEAARYLNCRSS